nr:ribonuclease H-like domain-containing protein [Tanacetum cinerariifolium]
MRMEQYLTHTDYALWEVIINGDSHLHEPPDIAIPDEHLLKFYSIKNAKSFWEAIKTRFGGNKESKKMHKTILKQQYVNFVASRSEGLDKTYDSINETINAPHDIHDAGSKEQPSALSYADDGNKSGDNKRRVVPVETLASALLVQYGLGGYDWSYQVEEGPTDFALMAHSSDLANSSNSEEILNKSNLEILGYQYGLESLEDRIRVHQKNETVFEESIVFLKYDVQVRDISIKDLKNQLEEAIKEKDDLKEKLTKFKESSKKLTKLINSQMSANDKTGLGYDSQLSENEKPECEIFEAASDSDVSEIDEDNNQAKDRYKVGIGYHVVPHPYTRNYMPPRADLSFTGLDDSVFKFKINETRTSLNENESIASKSSEEIREEPKTVRSSAPIIEDWESDSEDECMDKSSTKQVKSSNGNSVKSNECTIKNISEKHTNNHDENLKKDRILGLIGMGKGTGQRKVRPVWNTARRVNHQNFSKMTHPHPKRNFVPTAVATKLGQVLVNAAKQTSAASTNTARLKVNTAAIRQNVNAKSSYFKPHSTKRRHFNQKLAAETNTFSRKINSAKGKNVTTTGPKAVVNAA